MASAGAMRTCCPIVVVGRTRPPATVRSRLRRAVGQNHPTASAEASSGLVRSLALTFSGAVRSPAVTGRVRATDLTGPPCQRAWSKLPAERWPTSRGRASPCRPARPRRQSRVRRRAGARRQCRVRRRAGVRRRCRARRLAGARLPMARAQAGIRSLAWRRHPSGMRGRPARNSPGGRRTAQCPRRRLVPVHPLGRFLALRRVCPRSAPVRRERWPSAQTAANSPTPMRAGRAPGRLSGCPRRDYSRRSRPSRDPAAVRCLAPVSRWPILPGSDRHCRCCLTSPRPRPDRRPLN